MASMRDRRTTLRQPPRGGAPGRGAEGRRVTQYGHAEQHWNEGKRAGRIKSGQTMKRPDASQGKAESSRMRRQTGQASRTGGTRRAPSPTSVSAGGQNWSSHSRRPRNAR